MNTVPNIGTTIFKVISVLKDFHDADEAWGIVNGTGVNLVAYQMHVFVFDEVNEKIQFTPGHGSAKWVGWVCDQHAFDSEIALLRVFVSQFQSGFSDLEVIGASALYWNDLHPSSPLEISIESAQAQATSEICMGSKKELPRGYVCMCNRIYCLFLRQILGK